MSQTKKAPNASTPTSSNVLEKAKKAVRSLDPRDGLGVYIEDPQANPEGRVVEYDDEFVVINDKYPKARHVYKTSGILRRDLTVFLAFISF